MILPNSDISIMDVRNALGYPSTDLGTLCSCPNVNPRSKWKPIDYNGNSINASILDENNYGIYPVESNSISGLISNMDSATYIYKKPKGGQSSPYRLGDFRNYNSTAPLPVRPMGSRDIDNGGNANTILTSIENMGDAYTLGKKDIYRVIDPSTGLQANLRRGVYMINSSGDKEWCTSEIDWANIRNPSRWIGEVKCYDFYCNFDKTISQIHTGNANDRFLAIAGSEDFPNPYIVYLTGNEPAGSKVAFFTIKALRRSQTSNIIDYTLTMSSIGEVYRGGTMNNIAIQLNLQIDGKGESAGSAESFGSYTIGQEETHDWTGALAINSLYLNRVIYVIVYANNQIQARTAALVPMS